MPILSHNALSFASIISPHAAVFPSKKFKYAFNLHSIWKTKNKTHAPSPSKIQRTLCDLDLSTEFL